MEESKYSFKSVKTATLVQWGGISSSGRPLKGAPKEEFKNSDVFLFTFWGYLRWQWGSEFEVPSISSRWWPRYLLSNTRKQAGEKSDSTSSKSLNKTESELRDQIWTCSHLLSDGRRESKASADSFLLSGWVMLSMRSTHISITLPNNWSIWWDVMGDVEKRWIIRGVVII